MAAVIDELRAIETPPSRWPRIALAALLILVVLVPLLAWTFWTPQGTKPTVEAYPLLDPGEYQKRWADHLGLPVRVREEDGLTFVLIPPARLEGRLVRPFYLATTETTTAQFRRFVAEQPPHFQTRAERDAGWGIVAGAWVLRPGFSWRDLGEFPSRDDHPAPNVTGDEAVLYCRWRTTADHLYRLPSEREWEHACRAGSLSTWCFGTDETRLGQFAWTLDRSGERTHPVAHLRANAFGLHDTHGNLAEWCQPGDRTETHWPTRGGGFMDPAPRTTSASRKLLRSLDLEAGFRVVREIPLAVDLAGSGHLPPMD